MPKYYHNKHYAETAVTVAGPYEFKFGCISTSEDNDSTVGHILRTFYGCEEVTEAEVKAIIKKGEALVAEKEAESEAKSAAKADEAAKAAAEVTKQAEQDAAKKAEEAKAAEEAAKKVTEADAVKKAAEADATKKANDPAAAKL